LRFIYQGRELQDSQLVSECNIPQNAVILTAKSYRAPTTTAASSAIYGMLSQIFCKLVILFYYAPFCFFKIVFFIIIYDIFRARPDMDEMARIIVYTFNNVGNSFSR
jgi:hypothetical protein